MAKFAHTARCRARPLHTGPPCARPRPTARLLRRPARPLQHRAATRAGRHRDPRAPPPPLPAPASGYPLCPPVLSSRPRPLPRPAARFVRLLIPPPPILYIYCMIYSPPISNFSAFFPVGTRQYSTVQYSMSFPRQAGPDVGIGIPPQIISRREKRADWPHLLHF